MPLVKIVTHDLSSIAFALAMKEWLPSIDERFGIGQEYAETDEPEKYHTSEITDMLKQAILEHKDAIRRAISERSKGGFTHVGIDDTAYESDCVVFLARLTAIQPKGPVSVVYYRSNMIVTWDSHSTYKEAVFLNDALFTCMSYPSLKEAEDSLADLSEEDWYEPKIYMLSEEELKSWEL